MPHTAAPDKSILALAPALSPSQGMRGTVGCCIGALTCAPGHSDQDAVAAAIRGMQGALGFMCKDLNVVWLLR